MLFEAAVGLVIAYVGVQTLSYTKVGRFIDQYTTASPVQEYLDLQKKLDPKIEPRSRGDVTRQQASTYEKIDHLFD